MFNDDPNIKTIEMQKFSEVGKYENFAKWIGYSYFDYDQ